MNRINLPKFLLRQSWIYLLVIGASMMFVVPFVWMLGTSLKTDEELVARKFFPELPKFRASSPYIRQEEKIKAPSECPEMKWEMLLPKLLEVARTNVSDERRASPDHSFLNPDLTEEHLTAASRALVGKTSQKLHRNAWNGSDTEILDTFTKLINPASVDESLNETLARFELLNLQIRSLDAQVFNLESINGGWKLESGPATLFDVGKSTWVSYEFGESREPVILRYDFKVPEGFSMDDLHKLILSIRADNSWHQVTALLEVRNEKWRSKRKSYLAQYRPTSLLFQPPTFDDNTLRAKQWIPLILDSKSDADNTLLNDSAAIRRSGIEPVTFRLVVSPSSTFSAILGKMQRNYLRAFLSVPFWVYVGNSLTLVALVTLGSLFSASFVAYAFARLHWPGKGAAFVILLSTMMLPSQVTMIPSFLIWRSLDWYNTLNPMWVPAWFGTAFFIFLMTQHMKTIPKELEEAARMDGMNAVQTWWYIIVPQVKPSLAAIAIMTFMGAWNEFMGPLIYLRDQTKFPLSLGLFGMRLEDQGDWTMIMAGNVLMTFPVIVIFFLFQKFFVQGMTMTGMKG